MQITFNGGSSWDYIAPPATFRFAQCNSCPPGASASDCRLHLHGPTSWFSPEGEQGPLCGGGDVVPCVFRLNACERWFRASVSLVVMAGE